MAELPEVIVNIDAEMKAIIEWLANYKDAANEALSALNEFESDDPEIEQIQAIGLRALNIAAHERPVPHG